MGITALILFVILYGGSAWWNSWSSNYRRFLYKAPLAHTSIIKHGQQMLLQLSIDTAWLHNNNQLISYVVPDHGKLMHLFLIREQTDDVFAHLHPLRKDSSDYLTVLPDLPAGRYRVFGDIVRWNGFAETITDTITIPEKPVMQNTTQNSPLLYSDPDDTYVISNSINDNKNAFTGKFALICGKPGTEMKLADGSTATWQHAAGTAFEANKIYPLTFMIRDPSGQPAQLQPYMGMKGHAVIMKYDGSVYVHLHPVGNYSMASQQIIQNRINGNQKIPGLPDPERFRDSVDQLITKIRTMTEDERNNYLNANMKGMDMPAMNMSSDSMVTFPYAFPGPGNYRFWVQMKRDGRILNSAFDAVVE